MLTAEIDDTSFAFGGCRRHMAARSLTSACTSSSDMFGKSHRRASMYLSNAGLTNSHIVVSEMTFFGNRNASVNLSAALRSQFMAKLIASKLQNGNEVEHSDSEKFQHLHPLQH